MKKNKILFIVEGEVAEPRVLQNISEKLGIDSQQIYSYKTNIYTLYKKLKETFGEDEDYDIFSFIVELEGEKKNPNEIVNIPRSHISEIYLLFDFDAYDSNDIQGNIEKISELVEVFDNESELGKLYISYPMVEALTCYHQIQNSKISFYQFKINDKFSKEGLTFKAVCNENPRSHHLKKPYSPEEIDWIMKYHLLLCGQMYAEEVNPASYRKSVSTAKALEIQVNNSSVNDNLIYVYSGIAEFLLDYIKIEDFPNIDDIRCLNKEIINLWQEH